MKAKNVLIHTNKWYWGISETIIIHDGVGIVEIQYDNDSDIAFIKGLSVINRYHRHGIASELMGICEKRVMEKGRSFMQLSCHKGKDWLYEWYKRLGFDTFSWDEHEYVMVKRLC